MKKKHFIHLRYYVRGHSVKDQSNVSLIVDYLTATFNIPMRTLSSALAQLIGSFNVFHFVHF